MFVWVYVIPLTSEQPKQSQIYDTLRDPFLLSNPQLDVHKASTLPTTFMDLAIFMISIG